MTCTQQRFERDVAQHQITVVRDNGVDRHVKFSKPDSSTYWFEILTWPGALCIRGDCGTYVFSRIRDMFEFFRTTPERTKEGELHINPQYWMEKLEAVSKDGRGEGSATRFSEDVFKREVVEWFRRYTDARWYAENREDRWAIWEAVRELLQEVDSHDESHNWSLLRDFEVWNDETCKYEYRDFFSDWEMDCKEYGFGFLWSCYAIAWAIRMYDAAKVESTSAVSA